LHRFKRKKDVILFLTGLFKGELQQGNRMTNFYYP